MTEYYSWLSPFMDSQPTLTVAGVLTTGYGMGLMGKRNKQRIQSIQSGTRLPYRLEFNQSYQSIMSQFTTEQRLRGLGLLSVRPKLPITITKTIQHRGRTPLYKTITR